MQLCPHTVPRLREGTLSFEHRLQRSTIMLISLSFFMCGTASLDQGSSFVKAPLLFSAYFMHLVDVLVQNRSQ